MVPVILMAYSQCWCYIFLSLNCLIGGFFPWPQFSGEIQKGGRTQVEYLVCLSFYEVNSNEFHLKNILSRNQIPKQYYTICNFPSFRS